MTSGRPRTAGSMPLESSTNGRHTGNGGRCGIATRSISSRVSDGVRSAAAAFTFDRARTVAIYSLPRLLNEIRDTHRAERSHVDLLDRLTAVDLLHIDDVGAERTTDWVLEELYSIVNARYEDQRSMVITTNLYPDDLAAQIGDRIVSRLIEICGAGVEVPGEDSRVQLPG